MPSPPSRSGEVSSSAGPSPRTAEGRPLDDQSRSSSSSRDPFDVDRLTKRISRDSASLRAHLAGVVRVEVAKAIREALVDELREGGLSPLEVRRAFERLAG